MILERPCLEFFYFSFAKVGSGIWGWQLLHRPSFRGYTRGISQELKLCEMFVHDLFRLLFANRNKKGSSGFAKNIVVQLGSLVNECLHKYISATAGFLFTLRVHFIDIF